MSFRQSRFLWVLIGLACLVTMIPNLGCKESGGGSLPMSTLLTGPGVSETITAALSGTGKIVGKVLSKTSKETLSSIQVELWKDNTKITSTLTTGAGDFIFTGLASGQFILNTLPTAFYTSTSYPMFVFSDGTTLPTAPEILLVGSSTSAVTISAQITGLIVDESSKGISDAQISLAKDGVTGTFQSTRSTGEGKFSFSNIATTGLFLLGVSRNTYESQTYPVLIQMDGTVSPAVAHIVLIKTQQNAKGKIIGKVLLSTSKEGLPNVPLSLLTDTGAKPSNVSNSETLSDGGGGFYFSGLDDGLYLLIASGTDKYESATYPIRVLADYSISPTSPEILMTRKQPTPNTATQTVFGYVRSALNLKTLDYAAVTLKGYGVAISDINGFFRFENLTPNNKYDLEVTKFGYTTLNYSFTIDANANFIPTLPLKLDMLPVPEAEKGVVAGRISGPDGKNVVGKKVVRVFDVYLVDKYLTTSTIFQRWDFLSSSPREIKFTFTNTASTSLATQNASDPNLIGTFNLGHLEPTTPTHKYYVFIGSSENASFTAQPHAESFYYTIIASGSIYVPATEYILQYFRENPSDQSRYHSWNLVDVVSGKTTYLTNYEN